MIFTKVEEAVEYCIVVILYFEHCPCHILSSPPGYLSTSKQLLLHIFDKLLHFFWHAILLDHDIENLEEIIQILAELAKALGITFSYCISLQHACIHKQFIASIFLAPSPFSLSTKRSYL